tara:strand:- start:16341 stop:16835 length:495 start_codon:yes stop_codon:yes gene_type:complete
MAMRDQPTLSRQELDGFNPEQTEEVGRQMYQMISQMYDLPPIQGGASSFGVGAADRPRPSQSRPRMQSPPRQSSPRPRPPVPAAGRRQSPPPVGGRMSQIIAQRQQNPFPPPQMQQFQQPPMMGQQSPMMVQPQQQMGFYNPLGGQAQMQQRPLMAFNPYQVMV